MGSCLLKSFPLPHSVDIRICFSYVAVPSSYNPTVGEWNPPSLLSLMAPQNRVLSSLSPLFSLHATALDYTLDGDTDRRLRGQVPRVTFLSRGLDDPKHQSSGTVWLKHQQDRVCGDTVFQLQVTPPSALRVTLLSHVSSSLERQASGHCGHTLL